MTEKPWIWTHPINSQQNEFGEFHDHYPELRTYEQRFFEYFHVYQDFLCTVLLDKVHNEKNGCKLSGKHSANGKN